MAPKRIRESYDAAQKLAELEAALAQMEATQRPGQGAKKTKPEILSMAADRIAALLEKGFTQTQIAKTLEEAGVFVVRPQAILDAAGVSRKQPGKRTPGARSGGRLKRAESQSDNSDGGSSDHHGGMSAAQNGDNGDKDAATHAATNSAQEGTVAAAQRTTERAPTAPRHEPSVTRRAPIIGD